MDVNKIHPNIDLFIEVIEKELKLFSIEKSRWVKYQKDETYTAIFNNKILTYDNERRREILNDIQRIENSSLNCPSSI